MGKKLGARGVSQLLVFRTRMIARYMAGAQDSIPPPWERAPHRLSMQEELAS